MAQRESYEVGDTVWYALDFRRDKHDRRIYRATFARAEVIGIGPKRISIRLVGYPSWWRARSVSPSKVWF